jgi:hypothetical protein
MISHFWIYERKNGKRLWVAANLQSTRALAQSFVKLSIQEFIEVSGFKIDAIMLNYFWQFQTDLG